MRRETAVELPVTPSKSNVAGGGGTDPDRFSDRNVLASQQHASADQALTVTRLVTSTNYLTPSMSEPQPRPYKNSMESLRKNSSTDTEYSLQPYKVIKQSSNETASLTGSFNVDQPTTSFGTDISLDIDVSPNPTVIEAGCSTDVTSEEKPIKVTTFGGVEFRQSSTTIDYSRPSFLKKQFSIDQGQFAASGSKTADVEKGLVQKSCLKPPTIAIQHQQQPLTQSSTRLSSTLQESSSLSTDESKDDRTIPKISTNLVQDEIAKLSSNIKSSTEEEKAPPYNETMC